MKNNYLANYWQQFSRERHSLMEYLMTIKSPSSTAQQNVSKAASQSAMYYLGLTEDDQLYS